MARGIWFMLCAVLGLSAAARRGEAADLHPNTVAAFDRYVQTTEARMQRESDGTAPFLWADRLPDAERRDVYAKLQRGEIVVSRLETRGANGPIRIPDGLCHHWVGTVFAPGVRRDRIVALMQAYEKYPEVYRPNVRRAKTIAHEGDHFTAYIQLFMKKVISVVLNTEYDVRYISVAATKTQVRSHTTRIAEVEDPDTPGEKEKPVGHDNGFLWRFNNYCSIDEREDGTYVQCESISLSRGIPFGLGWMIGPFVTGIPRESLEFTLGRIRTTTSASGK